MGKDNQIKDYILQELNNTIAKSSDINYEVAEGIVSLHGMVDVLAEKWLAEETVKKVPGVVGVDNSLTVVMDREVHDKEIAENLITRFEKDSRIDLHQIKVSVNDGIVKLEGDVGTLSEANTAQEVAAREYGVKDVVNQISIGKGKFKRDEASITNDVELAFSRTPFVETTDIHTETFGNKVRLWGTVDTEEQIEAAVRVASQVPGVKGIDNQLTSRHGQQSKNDINLTNQLKTQLGQRGLGGVQGFVLEGTAYLNGKVDQPEQRQKAEDIVNQIAGIGNISNGINIEQH